MRRRGPRWRERLTRRLRATWALLLEARLHLIAAAMALLVLAGGTALWLIEGPATFATPFEAVWWALVTMTTVGYGDVAPQMVSGRAAAMVMMLFSMGVVAVFTARIASVFVATKLREEQGLQEIYDQGHLLVTGWHPGAERIVDPIVARARRQLTLVFVNNLPPSSAEEITTRYAGQRARYVRGDATQSAVLKRAGAADAWAAVVLPDHEEGIAPAQVDQQSVLTVLALRQITKSLPIVAYALTPQSVPHFRHSGAEQVVVRDSHAGFLLGSHLFSPGVPEVFQLLASHENAPSLDRMEIPEQFHGRPLKELEAWVRKRGGVLLGLAARQRTLSVSDILSDDTSGIDAFIRRKFAEAGRSPEELSRGRVRLSPDPEETVTGEEVAVVLHRNGKERP